MLVDSHCHLDYPQFDRDREEVIARAESADLSCMLTVCTRMEHVDAVRSLAEAHDRVYFATGLHPNSVGLEPTPTLDALAQIAEHPKCVAIGETGLDLFRSADTAPSQAESLHVHIDAARKLDLPLIIHARAADQEIGDLLTQAYRRAPFRCVMHCYSSGPELAKRALDLDFYLSMSGVITFRNADTLREIFADVPRDRILVETDAPYLAPVPERGKRNEPAFVRHTARVGAEVVGMNETEFARTTTDNFHRLFSKVPRPDAFPSDPSG